jgi:hypothetical protein
LARSGRRGTRQKRSITRAVANRIRALPACYGTDSMMGHWRNFESQPHTADSKKPRCGGRGFLQIQFRVGLSGQRRLSLLYDRCKCFGLVHGQISKNFAVHFDTGQVQAVDEAGIRQLGVMGAHSRVDPLDPQGAEVALAVLAVTGCVLVRLVDGLTRNFERIFATAILTFGCLDNFFMTGVSDHTTFCTGHLGSP